MVTLSIIVPCFNEQETLQACVARLLSVFSESTYRLDIVIVDDASSDASYSIAAALAEQHRCISVFRHDRNSGKGAAIRTGIAQSIGDYVAIQDADLEYDPADLHKLVDLLDDGVADVVYGSRFLSHGAHRVLYFWHSLGNRFLTLCSNVMTDLNLTDMETCYKVFRRRVLEGIELKENGFGIEPELTAKVAQSRCRVYEMGISYHGRTYKEGKKISWRDGFRALYCILKYNAPSAPWPVQFGIYTVIGGICAIINLLCFLGLFSLGVPAIVAAPLAFFVGAAVNYLLCRMILFARSARRLRTELSAYSGVVLAVAIVDTLITVFGIRVGMDPGSAKLLATATGFVLNFIGRKLFVFDRSQRGDWQPSAPTDQGTVPLINSPACRENSVDNGTADTVSSAKRHLDLESS